MKLKLDLDQSKIQEGLNFLKELQKEIPEAVIAGGYIRDAHHEVQSKDIDIFIPWIEPEIIDEVMVEQHAVEFYGATYMPQSEVTRIWDITTYQNVSYFNFGLDTLPTHTKNNLPVQIIMLAPGLNLEERIQQYDFGFCQCWTDGKEVYCTEEYMKDYLDNTCTLVYCEDHTQYKRSMRRFDRFKKKFPAKQLRIKEGIDFHAESI